MKRGGGKAKGGTYERGICIELSKWWSKLGKDDLFWRTHGSGNRATTRAKQNDKTSGQYGDVAPTDSRGKTLTDVVTISLKRGYNSVTLMDLIDRLEQNKESQLSKWIEEAIRDHLAADNYAWMLIVRRDRRKALAIIPLYLVRELKLAGARALFEAVPQVGVIWSSDPKRQRLAYNADRPKLRKQKDETPKEYLTRYMETNGVIWATTLGNFLREVKREHIVAVAKKWRAFNKEQKEKDKLAKKHQKQAQKLRKKRRENGIA